MALDLRLDIRLSGHQPGSRFRQRASQDFFDIIEGQLDLFFEAGWLRNHSSRVLNPVVSL
jgi:hypothetical protein